MLKNVNISKYEGDYEGDFDRFDKYNDLGDLNGFNEEGCFDLLKKYYSENHLNNIFSKDLELDFYAKRDVFWKLVNDIDKELKGINKKGYINDFIVADEVKFPLTSGLLTAILGSRTVEEKMVPYTLKDLKDPDRLELVKWWFNIINLDLYVLITYLRRTSEEKLKETSSIEGIFVKGLIDEKDEKVLLDLKVMGSDVRNGLESYIKLGLKKGGLTILQNTYTGFDSEYQYLDGNRNKLLSVQLGTCFRNILKLPTPVDSYENKGINSFSGAMYKLNSKNPKLNLNLIKEMISSNIIQVRKMLYPFYDESIKKLVYGLNDLGITNINKGEYTYFLFDKGIFRTWFKSDVEKGVSLVDLVKKSDEMTKSDREEALKKLFDLLIKIFHSNEESKDKKQEDKAKLLEFNQKESGFDFDKKVFSEDGVEYDEEEKGFKEGEEEEEVGVERAEYVGDVGESDYLKYLSKGKRFVRTYKQSFTTGQTSLTIRKNNYFIGHHTVADLSMLKDYEVFKCDLDIVNGSMVTLGKPILINGVNFYLRDTKLLAPGGNKSLKALGFLYGENKVKIEGWIEKMSELLKENYNLFKDYAVQDAKITLIHALFMEEFAFKFGIIGIPLSLSKISSSFLRTEWDRLEYGGYQVDPLYLLNDSKTQTPKGLFFTKDIGLRMSYYIANYKGGRNESFMYGVDDAFKWFDYDLVGAYTTIMSLMGNPDYSKAKFIAPKAIEDFSYEELIFSYIIIKGDFEFPKNTKFPSIPCFIDETTTIYPLKGLCNLTGAEYVCAKEQGCEIAIKEIFFIPFEVAKKSEAGEAGEAEFENEKLKDHLGVEQNMEPLFSEKFINKPFFEVIRKLQLERAKHPKGSILNHLFKELANSLYGILVKGISNKMKYDIKMGRTIRMEGNDLSNPILASWVTAFIRSLIGETLHNVNLLGGKVVSVTTDGFLTNLEDLEEKVFKMPTSFLLKVCKKARAGLTVDSDNPNDKALEIKKEGIGIITWTTRGQFSLDGNLMAATGFQRGLYSLEEIDKLLRDCISSDSKEITYINKRLRSAVEIFKYGGHVTNEYRDQIFRLLFDNKRKIIDKGLENEKVFDSDPVFNDESAKLFRFIGKKSHTKKYQRQLNVKVHTNRYKNVLDITIRNFIRCLLTNSLNLDCSVFKNYSEILEFVKVFDSKINLNTNTIAQLKRRSVKPKILYRDSISNAFIEYIMLKFPEFDDIKFFNELKDSKDSTGEGE